MIGAAQTLVRSSYVYGFAVFYSEYSISAGCGVSSYYPIMALQSLRQVIEKAPHFYLSLKLSSESTGQFQ